MYGTRSTRSKPQPFPTAEELPAELAAPKRNQRKKRATKSTIVRELAVAENSDENEKPNEHTVRIGDRMELDNERVDNARTEEVAETSEKVGIAIGELDAEAQIVVDSLSTQDKSKSSVKSPQPAPKIETSSEETEAVLAPEGNSSLTAGLDEVETRRSGRKRLAPTVLDEETGKTAKIKAGAKANARKAAVEDDEEEDDDDSEWDEEHLMTGPGSVYATNLADFFNPDVWGQLSESERAHLMKFLPECDKVYPPSTDLSDPTTPKAELVDDFWDNPQLLARISHVEVDIAEGRYTAENQAAIAEARRRSEAGEFNKFKDDKFEQFWGQKQRVNYEAMAGDTSSVKIQTLAKHNALRVGDVFSLRRSFGRGGITVEKDAKLTAIDPNDFSLTFSYPPGKLHVSSDQMPDKVISGVISITALESLLCKEDGRAPSKLPNGNAFKTFRIKRSEQDIGSLFDVRMEFHAKYLSPKAD